MMQRLKISMFAFGLLIALPVLALENDLIPQVGTKAQNSFDFDYIYATDHRAFAIAPGGSWAWKAN